MTAHQHLKNKTKKSISFMKFSKMGIQAETFP